MTTPQEPASRIALISFSDGRKRVHESLRAGIEKQQEHIAALIRETGAEPVIADEVVYTPRGAVREAKKLLAQDVAAAVFNIPVFAFPNLAAIAARVLGRPVAILSPGESTLPGMGGLLAAGGALHQMGIDHERIWGAYDSHETRQRLTSFVRGTSARHRLCGQVYGQIGGRSIGMLTGVSSSPAQWLRTFGVDIDHVDESEILRLAGEVDEAEKERIVCWLEQTLGGIEYEEQGKLTRENLKYQAACAAAVKQIIADRQFDFVGIKCHYDLSEYYCTQCLSAALLPSRLDWDGPRAPLACACEADGDGAMTMQILQLVADKPALFVDLRHYDAEKGLWTLCNCGGQSLYYSRRAEDPAENARAARLVPVIAKYGGVGAHVCYLGCEGPMTFARLIHDGARPSLLAFRGEAVEAQDAWTQASCPQWPHIYARIDPDPRRLLDELHANHVHAVEGDCLDALRVFARAADIDFLAL
jgi:L-fucose/D-arabinose isomerase